VKHLLTCIFQGGVEVIRFEMRFEAQNETEALKRLNEEINWKRFGDKMKLYEIALNYDELTGRYCVRFVCEKWLSKGVIKGEGAVCRAAKWFKNIKRKVKQCQN